MRDLHDTLNVTTVLVTHDQEEAMEVADRLAIINHGRLEQVGTPTDMYDHPANEFVLTFLGSATRLHDEWVRPHDLAIHRVEDGTPPPEAAEGLVTRITHLGFEVRVDVELSERRQLLGPAQPGQRGGPASRGEATGLGAPDRLAGVRVRPGVDTWWEVAGVAAGQPRLPGDVNSDVASPLRLVSFIRT